MDQKVFWVVSRTVYLLQIIMKNLQTHLLTYNPLLTFVRLQWSLPLIHLSISVFRSYYDFYVPLVTIKQEGLLYLEQLITFSIVCKNVQL